MAEAFLARFGPDRAVEAPIANASEDFGIFGEQRRRPVRCSGSPAAPIRITWTAAFNAGRLREDIPSNHSPRYAPVQDPTIATGIEAMITAALCWLAP